MSGAMPETIAFYLLAALAAGSAIGCVIASNIVRMAMCLLGTLGAVALLYFLMAANFLGAIQLIVYAGGTLIVIVFGVMLTSRAYGSRLRAKKIEVVAGAILCAALFVGLVTILVLQPEMSAARLAGVAGLAESSASVPLSAKSISAHDYTVAEIGHALMSTYLVPFELASVLLLAVMIGAAYLASPPVSGAKPPVGGARPTED
jgi:NADH-quinone oxidoreductase subunit J